MANKKTTAMFLAQVPDLHKETYDLSTIEYKGAHVRVKIVCPVHGEVWSHPRTLLNSKHTPCKHCSYSKGACDRAKALKPKQIESFISYLIERYGDSYDYSKIDYVDTNTYVIVGCPTHGEFRIKPCIAHKKKKITLCPKCGMAQGQLNSRATTEDFIRRAIELHGNTYNYDKTLYTRAKDKIVITCPIHGDFEQTAEVHLRGNGCNDCGNKSAADMKRHNVAQFIEKATSMWDAHCDYSKVEYKNIDTNVTITCNTYGDFQQTPYNHLKYGCPLCSRFIHKSKAEALIEEILNEMRIVYTVEHRFEGCKHKRRLPFDFYLPDYNMCIEYDGQHHYQAIGFWRGDTGLKETQQRDEIKNEYCSENGIALLRIRYDEPDIRGYIENALIS